MTEIKKSIHVNSINQTVWQEFKKMTKNKHGKINGALGQEVEQALKSYMKQHHTIKKYPKIKEKEKNFAKIAKKLGRYDIIFHKNLTEHILSLGISENTATSYIKNFLAMHWIFEITQTSNIGKFYTVDHDNINITISRYEEIYNISFNF